MHGKASVFTCLCLSALGFDFGCYGSFESNFAWKPLMAAQQDMQTKFIIIRQPLSLQGATPANATFLL